MFPAGVDTGWMYVETYSVIDELQKINMLFFVFI